MQSVSLMLTFINVQVKSELVSGRVAVGVRPFLNLCDFAMIKIEIKVLTYPHVTDTTSFDMVPVSSALDIPEPYPSCAVTRVITEKTIHKCLICLIYLILV